MEAEKITVDGVEYKVFVQYPTRTRTFDLKNGPLAGENMDGDEIRDLRGTYYSYHMIVSANPQYPEDYDAFYWKISEPVDYHLVLMPFGQKMLKFKAAISTGVDLDKGKKGSRRDWGDLDIYFKPLGPQRKPGDKNWETALL